MNDRRLPPLKSLQAFEAAGRKESFLEAATEQNVSPGAISRHVRILEQFLGIELFVRRTNGVTLTVAGKRYAQKVAALFEELRIETANAQKQVRARQITISTLPIFSERWLYHRIPSFKKRFKRTELQIEYHEGAHDGSRDNVDAWILHSNGKHPGCDVTRLFGEELVPVCSPELRKKLPDQPSIDDILSQSLLHDIYWDSDWEDWGIAVGVAKNRIPIGTRIGLYSGIIQAAVDGVGIAIGHSEMIGDELKKGKLVGLDEFAVLSPNAHHLVMKTTNARGQKQQRLKDWIVKECTNCVASKHAAN